MDQPGIGHGVIRTRVAVDLADFRLDQQSCKVTHTREPDQPLCVDASRSYILNGHLELSDLVVECIDRGHVGIDDPAVYG